MEAATIEEAKRSAASRQRARRLRLGALMLSRLPLRRRRQLIARSRRAGLSITQCKALLALAGPASEPSPRRSAIAERLGVSLPSMSRAVDGLVKSKLVTRVEDPDDRRVRRVVAHRRGPGAGRTG